MVVVTQQEELKKSLTSESLTQLKKKQGLNNCYTTLALDTVLNHSNSVGIKWCLAIISILTAIKTFCLQISPLATLPFVHLFFCQIYLNNCYKFKVIKSLFTFCLHFMMKVNTYFTC